MNSFRFIQRKSKSEFYRQRLFACDLFGYSGACAGSLLASGTKTQSLPLSITTKLSELNFDL